MEFKENDLKVSYLSEKYKQEYPSGEIYNFESFAEYTFLSEKTKEKSLKSKLLKNYFLIFAALSLIAFLTACIACFIDITAYNMIKYKKILVLKIENPYLGCAL